MTRIVIEEPCVDRDRFGCCEDGWHRRVLDPAEWRGIFYEWFRHQDLVNGATGTWKGEWTARLADSLWDALAGGGQP